MVIVSVTFGSCFFNSFLILDDSVLTNSFKEFVLLTLLIYCLSKLFCDSLSVLYFVLNLSTSIWYANNLKSLSVLLYSFNTFAFISFSLTFLLVMCSKTVNLELIVSSGLKVVREIWDWNTL